ncbi:ATP-dependent sacrificial sulfur transferase LarE [Nocardioides zeae]|uniref:ATP-dependent sacrificial sulfur transferase LarE n=1 Tax=Nocardioides imazamoxiresistens TaxID=3231893 RepID=A0ABU3PY62_9ACTN|nr:ATP-dependent sacrificial sulfur transferase LarE [Nocardioides zeae]MDT9594089.1 ATP-dependent sacrificial sulfur transferase LarE [Nocardioides zeae]
MSARAVETAEPLAEDDRAPLARLRERLAREERLVVALSGGVDSALLAVVAADVLGEGAVAVTAVSASLAARERTAARELMRTHGVRHVEVATDEFDRPEYVANAGDRCFHCKSALFDAFTPLSRLLDAPVALGTNLDDLGDHRPGLAAAKVRGAIAPMVDAGLTKADVRAAAAARGIAVAEKPAAACLSSRIAYGDPVTPEAVRAVEDAEAALADLGLERLRVRSHARGTVARIEVPPADLDRVVAERETIARAVRAAGFTFASVDLEGLQSGSMNALLRIVDVRS